MQGLMKFNVTAILMLVLLAAYPRSASAELTSHFSKPVLSYLRFDGQGQLWRARQQADQIWLDVSHDMGASFAKPQAVQKVAELSQLVGLQLAKDGQLNLIGLDDKGMLTSQMMPQLLANPADTSAGLPIPLGRLDLACASQQLAWAVKPDANLVAMWPQRVEAEAEAYDYMLAEMPFRAAQRATYARWSLSHCQQGAAALAAGGEGQDWWGYHMAWFDGGNDANGQSAGLYYARMDGVAWASTPAKKFAGSKNMAGPPALLSVGENVYLVWRESEAKTHKILGKYSDDGGRNWSEPKLLAETTGKADYPQLLNRDKQVYLAWQTAQEGLRLLAW